MSEHWQIIEFKSEAERIKIWVHEGEYHMDVSGKSLVDADEVITEGENDVDVVDEELVDVEPIKMKAVVRSVIKEAVRYALAMCEERSLVRDQKNSSMDARLLPRVLGLTGNTN